MKPIKIKPDYNLKGLTNVINKDEMVFIGRDGEEMSLWDSEAAAIKKLLEMLGDE